MNKNVVDQFTNLGNVEAVLTCTHNQCFEQKQEIISNYVYWKFTMFT